MIPLILLPAYCLFSIPLLLACITKDLLVKHEGFLAWHRNSVGTLVQRLFFSLLALISLCLFTTCQEDHYNKGDGPQKF
jgi:uncharacterized protein YqgC (DUF456 family)